MKCPKCGAEGIRLRLLEEICKDENARYCCPNFASFLILDSEKKPHIKSKTCDVEYFNEDGAF